MASGGDDEDDGYVLVPHMNQHEMTHWHAYVIPSNLSTSFCNLETVLSASVARFSACQEQRRNGKSHNQHRGLLSRRHTQDVPTIVGKQG